MAQLAKRAAHPRALVGAVILALVGALMFISASPGARGAEKVTTSHLGGADRYDTAREIAVSTFGTSDWVILARGDNYPDALAGNYVAGGSPGAPILLTPQDQLNDAAAAGIDTLKAKGVIILGGTSAVSQNVENALKSKGLQTKRLFGADRYGTAAEVAKALTPAGSTTDGPTAILASGEGFADALTGGPLSYLARFPMLLTTKLTLPSATEGALDSLGIKHVIILGGTDVISPAIEARLTAKQITSERLAGANRRETATKIATAERSSYGFAFSHVNLARGDAFPDALAGGPHSGKEKSSILLTESPDALGTDTQTYLRSGASDISTIHAFGGTSAVSDATLAAAAAAATCLPPSSTTTTAAGATTTTTTGTVSSTTTTTSGTVTTLPGSTTSTTAGQPACQTPSTTTTGAATTSTTSPPSQSLCSVLAVGACPTTTTTTGGSTTTSLGATTTTTTGTTTTAAAP